VKDRPYRDRPQPRPKPESPRHRLLPRASSSGGGGETRLTLLPDQFVTRISGRYGDLVDKLLIHITGGASVGGGGDTASGVFGPR
jgi:hypothetical protein